MGLIKTNGIEVQGVPLNTGYAKITKLYVEHGNRAIAYFGISDTRNNLDNNKSLKEISYECLIDKSGNTYEQIYTKAKNDIFKGWEDDIIQT